MGERRRGRHLTAQVTIAAAAEAKASAPAAAPPPGQPPALLVEDLSFAYAAQRVLDGVSFVVERGRFTALLGPNGAGKTTLFSLITRLLETRHGRVAICGRDVRRARWRSLAPLGIVFQQPTLDLDLTVRQNLAYFARLRGIAGAEAQRRIERELTRLGMAERAGEKVRALNGGHRRRVEIARALLHGPELLLLDEPTVGLDLPSRRAIVEHVHGLAEQRGIGILWATHLIDEVRATDDLVILHKGSVAARGVAGDVIAAAGARSLEHAFASLTGAGSDAE
jgi:ABC-2 type transport system ATP-binding protein